MPVSHGSAKRIQTGSLGNGHFHYVIIWRRSLKGSAVQKMDLLSKIITFCNFMSHCLPKNHSIGSLLSLHKFFIIIIFAAPLGGGCSPKFGHIFETNNFFAHFLPLCHSKYDLIAFFGPLHRFLITIIFPLLKDRLQIIAFLAFSLVDQYIVSSVIG